MTIHNCSDPKVDDSTQLHIHNEFEALSPTSDRDTTVRSHTFQLLTHQPSHTLRWYVAMRLQSAPRALTDATQLPLGLLTAATGHPMLVELKSGETLNGLLVNCDTWMNLTLREVVQTSADGDKFMRLPEIYVRGSTVSVFGRMA